MPIVAGVDFGTLSVRVTLLDSERGRLGTASAGYPLHRRREDPDFATQSHEDQMGSLVRAVREVMAKAGVKAEDVVALALDTTGSSVIPVDGQMRPLDEYMLWCDHRAHGAAGCIRMNGDLRSCCIGCGIILRSVRSLRRRWSIAIWSRRH
jgi:L-ribulokinase